MRSRLVMINVPTKGDAHTRTFYSTLLGVDFAPSLTEKKSSYHAPVGPGVQMLLNSQVKDGEPVTAYFAVDNLDESVATLVRLGGKAVGRPAGVPLHPKAIAGVAGAASASSCRKISARVVNPDPLALPPDMGKFALVRDPEGRLVGLIQLHSAAERFFKSQVPADQLEQHNAALGIAKSIGLA